MSQAISDARACVISFSDGCDLMACTNHRIYSAQLGYRHEIVRFPRTNDPLVRLLFKYHTIAARVAGAGEGHCFLFVESSLAFGACLDFARLFDAQGTLVFREPQGGIMGGLIGLRAQHQTRSLVGELLEACGRVFVTSRADESALWGNRVPPGVPVAAGYGVRPVAFGVSDCAWLDEPAWAISFTPAAMGGNATPVIFGSYHDGRLVDILIDALTRSLQASTTIASLAYPSPGALPTVCSDAPLAIVSLAHQVSYARYSRENFAHYCAAHDYALHFYAEIPPDLRDERVSAAWLKIEMLRRHIDAHDFIIWLDADMLFHDLRVPFAPLIEGRERIFARDIADWRINAGLMGFRNTPRNRAFLDALSVRLRAVSDRSAVYASQGDQAHTIDALTEHGMLDYVFSATVLNTHPLLYTPGAWLVHYMGYAEPFRTLYMAHDAAMINRTHAMGVTCDQDPQ